MQMRSLLGAAALVAVLLAASVRAAVHSKASDAACAVAPTPTVTFVASCTTIDVADASCWTPRVPGASDVVAFPAGTKASMPFALTYTPLSVQSVYVAPSAVVTLNGGAIAVSSCLTVFGTLALHNRVLDNGTASTIPFAADPSVPLGTDCSVVNAGFTPRVCGPGQVYVSGTLSLQGLYASLWAPTTVAAAGKLTAQRETFVWGTVTNYGTLTSSGYLFLHGSISNLAGASASFQQVRADFWTVNPVVTNNSVSIVNSGTLTFTVPKGWGIFNYASTRGWINYYPNDSWSAIVNLQLVNQASGQVTFSAPRVGLYQPWAETYGISSFYIVNHGTVTWSGNQFYDGVGLQGYPNAYGTGVVTNYGVLIADTSVVTINVVSEGGTMQTVNNGRFSLGMSAARRDSLRARGFVLSSSPVVTLRNTRIESVDATGSVTNLVPMALEGTLSVGPGATLVNGNKEGTTIRHLTTRASKGRVMIAGKYVTGSHEAVFSDDRAVSAELLASGTMHIAKGDVAVLRSDARLHVARGALLHVDGSLITEHVAQAARHHGLKISPQSFIVGKEHVTGDGIIPSAPLDA